MSKSHTCKAIFPAVQEATDEPTVDLLIRHMQVYEKECLDAAQSDCLIYLPKGSFVAGCARSMLIEFTSRLLIRPSFSMSRKNHRKTARICILQPDYLLSIVRRPPNWLPTRLDSVPPKLEVLKSYRVASFAEALDDVLRCNRHAIDYSLETWAIVQSTEAGL